MKRCPECRRDYVDDTLLYCLEDGVALVQGSVASFDEPPTAMLHDTAGVNEAATRAQIYTTDQTAVLPSGINDLPKSRSFDKRLLLAPLALAVIVLGGFIGYRYFAQAKQIESIAVMPFVNESGNADVEYLSDGMTETLIKNLSNVPKLSVKSRSTVFYYKGKETTPKKIGEELGVQAVLLGRVGGRGDDLKLSLELVNTQTQDVIWSEQYDRKQSDLVSLQKEIAKDVSTKLQLKLSGTDEAKVTKTATADAEAYQAYLKGRYYWNRRTIENLRKAIEQFKAATDRDPNYALAYAGLADCYILLPEYGGSQDGEAMPQARAFAERAIAIDDQLSEGHASLGGVDLKSWQWADSEREFKRAIELNPNYATAYHWYCVLLRSLGRYDEAAAMIEKAKELDPLSGVIGNNVAQTYLIRKDYTTMAEICLKLIELDPNYHASYGFLGLAQIKLGRSADAITSAERAFELNNRNSTSMATLGFVYTVAGKQSKADALLRELEDRYTTKGSSGTNIAALYAASGDKDKAFEWLEKDFQSRSGELPVVRWGIAFESLRGDPRYHDLLRRMGLPE